MVEWIHLEADRSAEEVLVMWDARVVMLESEVGRFSASRLFRMTEGWFYFGFSVYGPMQLNFRGYFREELEMVHSDGAYLPLCVCVVGVGVVDFNVVRFLVKRSGYGPISGAMRRGSLISCQSSG